MQKKLLIVTFSNNADHQDIALSMYETLYPDHDIWIMMSDSVKVPININNQVFTICCPNKPGIEKKTFDIKSIVSILRWIKKQQFSVIFFESLHVWNLPIMLKFRKKLTIIQMIHDVIPHDGDRQVRQVEYMNKVVCKLSSYIVICNQKFKSVITDKYKVPENNVITIDLWKRFPKYTYPEYTKHFLFFGRINKYKGIDNLIKIVKECSDVKFDVIGRVDESMQEEVELLSHERNVYLDNGYVSDDKMAEAFLHSDCVILPYNSATQSGVIIDAYRYSRPVIAFDVGAVSEQVEDAYSGFLIPSGDIVAFASKIKSLSRMDQDRLKELSRNAYEYGLKKYSAAGAKERLEELLMIEG